MTSLHHQRGAGKRNPFASPYESRQCRIDAKADGDGFTRRKFEWLDAIAADRDVSAVAFRVAYVIAGHVNRASGDAWPSQETLAGEVSVSTRTIRTAVADLVAAGYLDVTIARGPGRSSRYRMTQKQTRTSCLEDVENRIGSSGIRSTGNRRHASGIEPGKPEPRFHQSTVNTGSALQQYLPNRVKNSGSLFPTNPLIELCEQPSEKHIPQDLGFEEFWDAYPKRVKKPTALKAFKQIISKGIATADVIIVGAKRYAQQRTGQDPTFTRHPATWLNNHCWQDEDEPRTQSPAERPRSGAASAQFGIDAILGDPNE